MENIKKLTRDGVEIEINKDYYRQNGEIIHITGITSGFDISPNDAMSCYVDQNKIEVPLYSTT